MAVSGTPARTPPYKTPYDRYHEAVTVVAQTEVCRVFLWLYKEDGQYVGDYLKRFPQLWNRLNQNQTDQLERKEPPTAMDISLLYRLLQWTCGLADEQEKIWYAPKKTDVDSLEHSLYLLKKERNDLSHMTPHEMKRMSHDELDSKLNNVHSLCCRILTEAARRCGRHSELVRYTDGLNSKLQELKVISPEEFVERARQERLRTRRGEEQEGGDMQESWYLTPMLACQGADVPMADLLRCRRDLPTVILVKGEAGVGKTSLCQYLEESWIARRNEINDLQDCDLLLFFRCRDISSGDFVRLLQEDLLPETTAFDDPYRLSGMVQELKVFWVLDGLEEATREAFTLIKTMLKKRLKYHTILLTSRPEHSLTFMNNFSNENILDLTVCGIDPKEAIQKWIHSTDNEKHSTKLVKHTIANFEKLHIDVQKELRNPLKMKLVLQNWENTCRDLQEGFHLSRLYQNFCTAQIASLVSKFTKANLTKREATRKADKWFEVLCKVAFAMTREQKVTAISESVLRKLEDTCDDLQVSSTEGLSAFLAHHDNIPSGCSAYSFFHGTQQYFLAANHTISVFKSSSNTLHETCRMFGITSLNNAKRDSLVHFYEVFLHIIFILGNSASDDNLDILIELLRFAILDDDGCSKWFEVVQKGSYNEKLTKRVADVIPDAWYVSDSFVKAADQLLDHKKPQHIIIQLNENPRGAPDLLPLLRKIADIECWVWVELYLSYHLKNLRSDSTSDRYLSMLCYEDSPCGILGFEGHLSKQGYDLLKVKSITQYCEKLSLKVKSKGSLERLCTAVKALESLLILNLSLALKNPSCVFTHLPDKVNLDLPYMTDSNAENTALLVSELSRKYESITVSDVTNAGASDFVRKLHKEGVHVNSLVRLVSLEESGYTFSLSYGRVPLQYSMLDFIHYWHHWEKAHKGLLQAENLTQCES